MIPSVLKTTETQRADGWEDTGIRHECDECGDEGYVYIRRGVEQTYLRGVGLKLHAQTVVTDAVCKACKEGEVEA